MGHSPRSAQEHMSFRGCCNQYQDANGLINTTRSDSSEAGGPEPWFKGCSGPPARASSSLVVSGMLCLKEAPRALPLSLPGFSQWWCLCPNFPFDGKDTNHTGPAPCPDSPVLTNHVCNNPTSIQGIAFQGYLLRHRGSGPQQRTVRGEGSTNQRHTEDYWSGWLAPSWRSPRKVSLA